MKSTLRTVKIWQFLYGYSDSETSHRWTFRGFLLTCPLIVKAQLFHLFIWGTFTLEPLTFKGTLSPNLKALRTMPWNWESKWDPFKTISRDRLLELYMIPHNLTIQYSREGEDSWILLRRHPLRVASLVLRTGSQRVPQDPLENYLEFDLKNLIKFLRGQHIFIPWKLFTHLTVATSAAFK